MAGDAAAAIDTAGFAALMAPFEPFEPAPWLAVGVSGGADSTALCILTEDWARRRGGRVSALLVDHRLRPESVAEAEHVAAVLRGRGIAVEILAWPGPPPSRRVQERARAGRLALLTGWCRRAGVLHLLLGHHRRDQLETVIMRGARRGGDAAAAGMAPIVDTPAARILRPLLAVEPARVRATLTRRGVTWIEDPSNRDPRFERVRVRQALAAANDSGDAQLARAAGRAQRNAATETAVARLLARTASVHPAGFAWLAAGFADDASAEVARAALAALLTTIGGREHHPPQAAVDRLIGALGGAGATLHGCRIVRRGDRLLIFREMRTPPPPLLLSPGERGWWDGRFFARVAASSRSRPLRLDGLGRLGWQAVTAEAESSGMARRTVPALIAPTLPAIFDEDGGIVAVPHLGVRRAGTAGDTLPEVRLRFWPRRPVLAGGTFLAAFVCDTM